MELEIQTWMSSCSLQRIEGSSQDHKRYGWGDAFWHRLRTSQRSAGHRMQIACSAKGAGSVELIKLPTCTHCMEPCRWKLQLPAVIYYLLTISGSSLQEHGTAFSPFLGKNAKIRIHLFYWYLLGVSYCFRWQGDGCRDKCILGHTLATNSKHRDS